MLHGLTLQLPAVLRVRLRLPLRPCIPGSEAGLLWMHGPARSRNLCEPGGINYAAVFSPSAHPERRRVRSPVLPAVYVRH
ncbi:hypothetical protein DP806_16610 [Salmonella enterica subsp. enterica serovar Saintpaul]|nr:hypothetical protein [Salmonella enterica subsp. enterica serovar Saintpaul]